MVRRKLLRYKQLLLMKAIGYRYVEEPIALPAADETLAVSDKLDTLERLHAQVRRCHLCELSKSRNQPVPGSGKENAVVMFVGDFPGMIEDQTGRPFAGRSGEMLDKMIRNVLELDPARCYLTYTVKCKPQNLENLNRYAEACEFFLSQEIALVSPRFIVALGERAYRILTGDTTPFDTVRGTVQKFNGTPCIATHSLSFLLRNPSRKKETLLDLQRLKALL